MQDARRTGTRSGPELPAENQFLKLHFVLPIVRLMHNDVNLIVLSPSLRPRATERRWGLSRFLSLSAMAA